MRSFLFTIMFLASLWTVGLAQNTPKAAVQVELNPQKPFHLAVTLKSGSASTVTIYRSDLPWGIRDSMVFAAVKPNGEPIDLALIAGDPGPTEVSVRPRETLTGDIDLRNVIRDLDVLKRSDVLLFWAYKSPDELHIPRWSGGLVVIPQQK